MAYGQRHTVSLVIAAAAAALASALAMSEQSAPERRFIASEHPAAVLAWAQTRCDSGLALSPGAPRAHAEDVLQAAAAYEAALRYQPLDKVCAGALAAAGRLSASKAPAGAMLAAR